MVYQHKKLIFLLVILSALAKFFSDLSSPLTYVFLFLAILNTFILGFKFIADDFKTDYDESEKLVKKRNYKVFIKRMNSRTMEKEKIWNLERYD